MAERTYRLRLVLATRNRHKVREITDLLGDLPVDLLSLDGFPDVTPVQETGATLEENAVLKATSIARATAFLSLADDSGLEVDALGGAPGVHSSRFAGEGASYEDNNRKLLSLMENLPPEKRKARFRCVAALAEPSGVVKLFQGTCDGWIDREPRGSFGFGYDPVFVVPEWGQTLAELGPEVKNRISHRANAIANVKQYLQQIINGCV